MPNIETVLAKVNEAVARTRNDLERHYLIRWVFISAIMLGVIDGWRRLQDPSGTLMIYEIHPTKEGGPLEIVLRKCEEA